MRITLCGSMRFADRIVEIFNKLKELGHEPLMHDDVFGIADGTAKEIIDGMSTDHGKTKRKHNYIKWWHNCIKSGDAVLICNFDKNGVKNYVGGNTLMEIAFAHVNDKKVFLLNPIPKDVPYTDEIKAMADVVLDGDLRKIK